MKKIAAAAALSVAGLAAAVAPASASDDVHNSTAPMGGLVNVNGDVLSDLCVAPWHWDGPIQVLTDNAPYQACQSDGGGIQTDAPAVDMSNHHNAGDDVTDGLPVPFLRAL